MCTTKTNNSHHIISVKKGKMGATLFQTQSHFQFPTRPGASNEKRVWLWLERNPPSADSAVFLGVFNRNPKIMCIWIAR